MSAELLPSVFAFITDPVKFNAFVNIYGAALRALSPTDVFFSCCMSIFCLGIFGFCIFVGLPAKLAGPNMYCDIGVAAISGIVGTLSQYKEYPSLPPAYLGRL
jgi:hypothetical protein